MSGEILGKIVQDPSVFKSKVDIFSLLIQDIFL